MVADSPLDCKETRACHKNILSCGHRHRLPRGRAPCSAPKSRSSSLHETQEAKMVFRLGSTERPHPCVASRIGRALRLDLDLRFEGGFVVYFPLMRPMATTKGTRKSRRRSPGGRWRAGGRGVREGGDNDITPSKGIRRLQDRINRGKGTTHFSPVCARQLRSGTQEEEP